MPELPEVETVRRGLLPVLEGKRIVKARAFRADLRFPFPENMTEILRGSRVVGLDRRAKYLLATLDSGHVWLSHLGMSGRFRVYQSDPPSRDTHDHVELETEDGVLIRYNDPRRFGIMDLVPFAEVENHNLLVNLGPEPLSNSFDGKELGRRIGEKRTAIKIALLDQKVVAGVGNIYASEALFRAGISPRRTARTVKRGRAESLAAAVRDVLADAIASGGSSLRDHRQTNGELGYFQHRFKVYDRAGEPCPRCGDGSKVKQITQAGRSTFFCSKCQR